MQRSAAVSLLTLVSIACTAGLCFASGWEAIGPYGGHAQKVAIDPGDHNHLYASTKNGQLYHSIDAGEHWLPLPFSLNSTVSLSTFILNPQDGKELYAGVASNFLTPEAALDPSNLLGVYKSSDGGLSWARLPATAGWSVRSIVMHPVQTGTVIAGTEDGIFRTVDSGLTWTRISPVKHPQLKAIVSLAIDTANPKIIFAGTTHLPWRTLNGGITWQSIHVGISDDSDVFTLAIDSTNPLTVFLGACSGIYRTQSRGTRWLPAQRGPEGNLRTYQILQDALNTKVYFAATQEGLWKSLDGGRVWQQTTSYPYVVNSVAVDPESSDIVYLATDKSGLLKSVDGGITFDAINQGFVNRNVSRLIDADSLYLTSAYDGDFGGIFATVDLGTTWSLNASQNALLGRNIVALAVAPGRPNELIAGSYDGLLTSDDGGKTWQMLDTFSSTEGTGGKVHDVAFARGDPKSIYVATDEGLFESSDGGGSWQRNPSVDPRTSIYRISLHPTNPRIMALYTSSGVLFSKDGGSAWVPLEFGERTAVYDVAFSSAQPGRILAASSRGLLYSDTDGLGWYTWVNGIPAVRFDQILSVRNKPEDMYLLSRDSARIWRSVNAGRDWQEIDSGGLAGLSLLSISVSGEQPFVVTESHGVFRWNTRSDVAQESQQQHLP